MVFGDGSTGMSRISGGLLVEIAEDAEHRGYYREVGTGKIGTGGAHCQGGGKDADASRVGRL